MDAAGGIPGGGPLVLFDLDGTLLDGQTIHHLAERYGVLDEARRRWARDDRGPTRVSAPVKAAVAELFAGAPLRELASACAELDLHPEAHDVVEALRERGCTVGVVTASYHPAADRARRELMLDLAVGVELETDAGGHATGGLLPSGYDGACDEWVCKRAVLAAQADRFEATATIAVGDGRNDACMLEAADVGIAVDGAVQAARQAADVQAPLADVPSVVEDALEQVQP